MAVHVVTVIHRPQGVEEEAGGKREPGGVQGDHQEEGQEEEEVPGEEDRLGHQIGPILLFRRGKEEIKNVRYQIAKKKYKIILS